MSPWQSPRASQPQEGWQGAPSWANSSGADSSFRQPSGDHRAPTSDGYPTYATPPAPYDGQGARPDWALGAPAQAASGSGPGGWTPAAKQLFLPIRPVSFGALFASGFREFRQNFRGLAGLALIWEGLFAFIGLLAPLAAVLLILIPAIQHENAPDAQPNMFRGLETFAAGMIVTVSLVIPFAALTLGQIFVQAGATVDVANATIDRHLRFREMSRRIRPRIGALLAWIALVLVAAIIAFIALVSIQILAANLARQVDKWQGGSTASLGISFLTMFLIVALALCIAALMTKLALVPSIIVMEKRGPFAAIRRSWQLTRGSFWRYFGVTVLVNVVINVAANAITAVVTVGAVLVYGIIFSLNGTEDPASPAITAIILSGVSTVLLVLFYAATTIVTVSTFATMYLDARIRQEGLDQSMQRWVDLRAAGSEPGPSPFDDVSRPQATTGWAPR